MVAELVMGYAWDEKRCRVCGWPLAASVDEGCVADNCSQRPLPKHRAGTPSPYTTDIAAAFQVVGKMENEFQFHMNTTCDKGLWDVTVCLLPSLEKPIACLVFMPLPEAICIAALRAKGHEVIL